MGKEVKTNAMRILDKNKIPYEILNYECGEFIGLPTAEATGAPVEQSFKTLVMQGKSRQYYVFVIPIADEVDLKAAARAVGEKSVEMIHVKDITAITGYVRGGCSPLGMKKQFPTIVHESVVSRTRSPRQSPTRLKNSRSAAGASAPPSQSIRIPCLPWCAASMPTSSGMNKFFFHLF